MSLPRILLATVIAAAVLAADEAARADGGSGSFLDSIGINMQLDRADHAARAQLLLELGIRHNRCTTGVQGVRTVDATVLGRITDLAAHGVRATVLWSRWSPIAEMVSTTADLGDAVDAVEGPNETNLASESFVYNGVGFPVGSRAIQHDLYAAFKADARVQRLPVFLTTVAPTAKYADLGDMEAYGGSRNMDFGNMHCYYVTSHLLGDKLRTYHIANARLAAPTLPLVCTETGWSTADVSELAQAKYALRAFCEGFRVQVRRTYWFELADDGNGLFGLVRADLSRKPAFTALRDLIALLRDAGGSSTYPLGSLALTFAGAPASLRHLLLRDSSGTWSIVVWNEVLSYDNGADLAVAPVPVVVGFGASFGQVAVHRPLDGVAAVASATDVAQIAVQVPDHPLVIRLRPASAPTIVSQPADATVTAPATATFTVAASGLPTPTWQWQWAPPGSATFAAIGGATAASYTTPATAVAMSGTRYRCVATNSAGSATSSSATLTVHSATQPTIRINFQPANAAAYAGYLIDSGAGFAARGNGQTYGWIGGANDTTRDRNAAASPDQRYDTIIHLQKGGDRTWEIAVPDGSYQVQVVCGDPSYIDSVYRVDVEGVRVVDGTPTGGAHWISGTQTVTVGDGRLTVRPAAGATNAKLCFIDIVPAAAGGNG